MLSFPAFFLGWYLNSSTLDTGTDSGGEDLGKRSKFFSSAILKTYW